MYYHSRKSTGQGNNRFQKRSFGGNHNASRRFQRPMRRLINEKVIYEYVRRATVNNDDRQYNQVEEQVSSFADLSLPQKLKDNIIKRGYSELTPIQNKAIPAIRNASDIIGIANTGTGKTAAFLIPLIENIMKDKHYRALIITPTRELALQIRDELNLFAQGMYIRTALCIGQSSMSTQINDVRRMPSVVVGTPGRLKDLINRGVLRLDSYRMIVLDEADQMLNMGFLKDIKHIISFLPEERQSLFFSATVSTDIKSLIHSFVKNPVTISVKKRESVAHIKHDIVQVERTLKFEKLSTMLAQDGFVKVIVFGRTKRGVEQLARDLHQKGFDVASLHGNKSQFQRQRAITMFKQDRVNILVATDVAARGLDIPDVSHVINYDVPESYEDYVHRTGRTGRANKEGTALTLIS